MEVDRAENIEIQHNFDSITDLNDIEQIPPVQSDERGLDIVYKILQYAKLEKDELKPGVQSLYFSPTLNQEEYKFMELDNDLIDHIKVGNRLILKGEKHENVILCTEDKTFDVKEAETSNSLLLIPECSYGENLEEEKLNPIEVTSVIHKYFELKPCRPKLQKLRRLLETNQYAGRLGEEDNEQRGAKYTYDDLVNLVQASEAEISEYIDTLPVCNIDGYVRLIDAEYLSNIVCSITTLTEEKDWSLDRVPCKECCDVLDDLYPRDVVKHVLQMFSTAVPGSDETSDDVHYALNEEKLSIFYAETLLRTAAKFNLKDFLLAWQGSVPRGMRTDLLHLDGIAIIDRENTPNAVRHFPVYDLSEDIGERFNELFHAKDKWTAAEITPYVNDLATEKTSSSMLLTKYCRSSLQGGIRYFTSRRPLS